MASTGVSTRVGAATLLITIGAMAMLMTFGVPSFMRETGDAHTVVFDASGTGKDMELTYSVTSNVRGKIAGDQKLISTTVRESYFVNDGEHLTVTVHLRLPDVARANVVSCHIYHRGSMVSQDVAARGADGRVNAAFAFCKYTT